MRLTGKKALVVGGSGSIGSAIVLGLAKEGIADIVDVKCGPFLMGAYRGQPGILPGYHMNKDNWITILLDGTAEEATIKELLQISYDLTGRKTKAKRYKDEASCTAQ